MRLVKWLTRYFSYLQFSRSSICLCVNGKLTGVGGFTWRRARDGPSEGPKADATEDALQRAIDRRGGLARRGHVKTPGARSQGRIQRIGQRPSQRLKLTQKQTQSTGGRGGGRGRGRAAGSREAQFKPVEQVDLVTGVVIRRFASQIEAVNTTNVTHNAQIT